MNGRYVTLALLLLATIVAAGSYLRLAELGRDDFDVDELYQYYAAESLTQGEGPELPSGRRYTRGIEVTHLTSVSLQQIEDEQAAARLPSALLGVLGLVVFAAILWALAGPWAACWGTLLLALYPEAIDQSRQLRFYTYQLFFGLLALYTGWRVVRRAGSAEPASRTAYMRQALWALATALALFLAYRAQVTTMSVAVAWGFCLAVAGLSDLFRQGKKAFRSSVPLQLTLLGAVAALSVLIIRPGIVADLAARSQMIPLWAVAQGANHPLSYYYILAETYPLIVSLAPLIFIVVAFRQPRLSAYLFLWFAIPLFLHSFVFPWNQERFVLLAMPALFAAAGIAAARGSQALYDRFRTLGARFELDPRTRRAASGALVALVALSAIVTTPAFNEARKSLGTSELTDRWTEQAAVLEAMPDTSDIPIGGWRPLPTLFYLGSIDFMVTRTGLENGAVGDLEMRDWAPEGTLEDEAGVPVLTSPAAIQEYFEDEGAVLISTEAGYEINGEMDPELVEVLHTEARELCSGRCGRLRLYLWDFGNSRSTSPADRATAARLP